MGAPWARNRARRGYWRPRRARDELHDEQPPHDFGVDVAEVFAQKVGEQNAEFAQQAVPGLAAASAQVHKFRRGYHHLAPGLSYAPCQVPFFAI